VITKVCIKFDKYYHSTKLSHLVSIYGIEVWLPKKYCQEFTVNKKLGGHTIIPTWLYRLKFGCEPNEYEAATIVEHHTPEKIEKVISNEINELKK